MDMYARLRIFLLEARLKDAEARIERLMGYVEVLSESAEKRAVNELKMTKIMERVVNLL